MAVCQKEEVRIPKLNSGYFLGQTSFESFQKEMNMITQDSVNNCRFCCVVSKAIGEDPIGSAPTYEHWLALEIELPWTEKCLRENPVLPEVAL